MIARYIPPGPFNRTPAILLGSWIFIKINGFVYMYENPDIPSPASNVTEFDVDAQITPDELFEAMEIHALKQMPDARQTI